MNSNLTDKTAVVTGASHGLGQAIAQDLASRGAHVVMLARSPEPLRQAADAIRADGGAATVMPCDVSDAAQVQAAAAEINQSFDAVHILINNAGIPAPRTFEETQISNWDFRDRREPVRRLLPDACPLGLPHSRRFRHHHKHQRHGWHARWRQPGLRQRQVRPDRLEPCHRPRRQSAQYPLDHTLSRRHGYRLAWRSHRRAAAQRVHGPNRCRPLHRPNRDPARRNSSSTKPC